MVSTVTEEPLCNAVLQRTMEVGTLGRDVENSVSVHNLRIEVRRLSNVKYMADT
jgi:hypothetical protein